MTFIAELDLNSIEMKQHVRYLGQRSLSSKVIVTHTRHTDCSQVDY